MTYLFSATYLNTFHEPLASVNHVHVLFKWVALVEDEFLTQQSIDVHQSAEAETNPWLRKGATVSVSKRLQL